jgi:hypothetical protein
MSKTKADLMKKAIAKLKTLTKEELQYFVEFDNCCQHTKTHPVGMDNVCDKCGDWV